MAQPKVKLLLELKEIFKIFNQGKENEVEVLRGVNLGVAKGELLVLAGPSGSGKSTLMNIMGLLDRPTAGKYFLSGIDVSRLKDKEAARVRREEIGFVFQNFNLLSRLSALQNVLLPTTYSHLPGAKTRAASLLKMVGLKNRINTSVDKLSGGEKQRVAIARALVNEPHIIIADEPTGNLDSKTGAGIIKLLAELNQKGVTILIVTHDENIVKRAPRVLRIRDGELVS